MFRVLIAFLVGVSLFAGSMTGHGEERTLTNREGKKITATIETVRAGQVFLSVSGNRFQIPFASLSDDDQKFLKEWVEQNHDYRFEFRIKPVEDVSARASERNGDTKIARSQWKYEVELRNLSGLAAKDLRIEYRVFERFTSIADMARSKSRKEENGRMHPGSAVIDEIANSATGTFSTESLPFENKRWKTASTVSNPDGTHFDVYNNHETSNELDGIWIRIHIGERLIAEHKSEGKMIKVMGWEGELPEPR